LTDCPICAPEWAGRALIELDASYVVGDSGPSILPGYTAVFAKRHVREPFELGPEERAAWWGECMLVAHAVAEVFEPVKMNYEIHGNTIEHLHLHLFPRFGGDPFEGRAIEPREPKRYVTTPDRVEALKRAVVRLRGSV
jgi:diadenosine tetraphosphate (Ap4A) HIT family hydrolase